MACNGSACQSGCYRSEEQLPAPACTATPAAAEAGSLCIKCQANEPLSCAGGTAEDSRFCAECFRSNLFGKFRQAVTSNAMISPTDKVLVAFSGGPASRVALQFMHDLQYKAQQNFDASRDRSLPVFVVGVAFIDESAAISVSADEMGRAIQDIKSIVSNLSPPTKEFHHVPIENIYSGGLNDQRIKLKEILSGISDATGKEDFLVHLRMLSLQKIAAENRYNRVLLGSCTSRIASHVLTATVKGQGYSLPADIQYVDARWETPVVLPLRDCPGHELNTLCRIDSHKTIELPIKPCSSINNLVSSFVALLQEENPSRESTIVRTAGKLTPFAFNRIPEMSDSNVPLATRRRQKRSSAKLNGSISSDSFCPICYSPLNKSDMPSHDTHQTNAAIFEASCCSSCRFQILAHDDASYRDRFYSLLPQPLVARARNSKLPDLSSLREQIQDFLLSDGENES